MRRPAKPARYEVIPLPEAVADILALAEHGAGVVAAAAAIVDDLAHGRVVGKDLGARNISGDLSGIARVKSDLLEQRPQRFRLLYRHLDRTTLEVIAVGVREQHAIYQLAASRLTTGRAISTDDAPPP